MLAKSLIKKMNVSDWEKVRDGASLIALIAGGVAYANYRMKI